MQQRHMQFRFGGALTPVIKWLIISNIVLFVLRYLFMWVFRGDILSGFFGLSHVTLVEYKFIWQIFTYMFIHGGPMHLLFNLFALFMFGGDLERKWGSRYFLKYYLLSGLGAGIFIGLMNYYMYMSSGISLPTIGASGAIYGILLAYGMNWPDREVLVYFILPIKMKYLVIIFGVIEFFGTLGSVQGGAGNISHIGHLGGLISGFILLMLGGKQKSVMTVYNANGSVVRPVRKNKGFFGSFMKNQKLRRKQNLINNRIKAKEIIDRTLEKIGTSGMESLTPKERADLEWARKNYYPDNNATFH